MECCSWDISSMALATEPGFVSVWEIFTPFKKKKSGLLFRDGSPSPAEASFSFAIQWTSSICFVPPYRTSIAPVQRHFHNCVCQLTRSLRAPLIRSLGETSVWLNTQSMAVNLVPSSCLDGLHVMLLIMWSSSQPFSHSSGGLILLSTKCPQLLLKVTKLLS